MSNLHFTKVCPKCGTAISGWHARLLSKDHAIANAPIADALDEKATWGPFACTACGAKLVLTYEDPRLVHKLAGAIFVSVVAGFVLPAFIGLATCFSCGLILVALLVALSGAWIIARAIKVGVVKTAPIFISDPGRPDAE